MLSSRHRVLCAAVGALLGSAVSAQGKFVNYEDPQVKPIAIAELGGLRFLCACNTPDNSLEVFQTTAPYALIARVPVGLSPVTVRWNPADSSLYTCNYLGDSVSRIRLGPVAITPTGTATVRAMPDRTQFVGDEPTDIVFTGDNALAYVSLHGRGGLAMLNVADLSTLAPFAPIDGPSPIPGASWGIKAPRRMELLADGRFYVINTLAGEIRRNSLYDAGLFTSDPTNPPPGQSASHFILSGVGSTNFNLAIDGIGRRMFVVAQIAMNQQAGVDAVAAQPTGFVQSWLQVVDLRPGAPGDRPQLIREQTGGLPIAAVLKPVFRSINLNRDYSQAVLAEVPPADALAQPTDVVTIEDVPGAVQIVALTAFGSDKVAILRPDGSQPSGWAITRIALPIFDPAGGYSAVGPRALVYDGTAPDPMGLTRPGMLFVLNSLDHSLAVINPWNGSLVAQRSLGHDPTPREIRVGRKFLYSASFSSGNKMVACASCHVDARTDALGWKLGNLDAPGPAIPPHFHDGDTHTVATMPNWPNDKPITVTQTLQGLLNHHVEPFDMTFVTTNAPYHWRGDKLNFQDFNEAFVRLQHRTSMVSEAEMNAYTAFINTIHHPPNPEQSKDRTFSGATGDPNSTADGNGALLGRKLFHIMPNVGSRSCVHCHGLPDGSSNTLTVLQKQRGSIDPRPQTHPFESAATRSVFMREMVRPQGWAMTDLTQPFSVTGAYGLLHAGIFTLAAEMSLSINDFVHRTFFFLLIDPPKAEAVTRFMREFDSGTAPAIGLAATVDLVNPAIHTAVFNLVEQQAREGNVGVAAYARSGAFERGYWFDVTSGLYVQEGALATVTRAQLIASVTGPADTVWVQATPTGSERRVASLTGMPAPLLGLPPMQITLLPMVPDTAFVGVTDYEALWDPNHPNPAFRFLWDPFFGPEPISMKSIRTLQTAVQGNFGVPTGGLRHEAPRRLRVSGLFLRNGAKLGIGMPSSSPSDPPDRTVWFDLTPTRHVDSLGRNVWETAEELDPMQTMALLNGGYWAPGVRDVLYGVIPPGTPLAPLTWNHYDVSVRNEDGTMGNATVQQTVTIADVR